MKYCFGDIVVVEGERIGVIVKCWCSQTKMELSKGIISYKEPSYDVYVQVTDMIVNYGESQVQRYMVRHKYLDEQEVKLQKKAVEGN